MACGFLSDELKVRTKGCISEMLVLLIYTTLFDLMYTYNLVFTRQWKGVLLPKYKNLVIHELKHLLLLFPTRWLVF